MPTYEYACRDCGDHLEVVQSFRDEALTVCPACHGRLRKVFSAAGIVFRGSGWHSKDYATTKTPKADRDAEPGAEDKASTSGPSAASEGKAGTSRSKATSEDKAGSPPANRRSSEQQKTA